MNAARILLVTPAPRGSRKGNRITAERWARRLRAIGCRVTLAEDFTGQPCDLLLALHARKSAAAVTRFHDARPTSPIVLALTGTDLYDDLAHDAEAQRAVRLATRLVLLQPHGRDWLPKAVRDRARVIYQSVEPPRGRKPRPLRDAFEVVVLGHLRDVKDPLRAAFAVRKLPPESRLLVTQVGGALSPKWERAAQAEAQFHAERYQWLGELPRGRALRVLARSRLLVVTSRLEGGANVISEAITLGVPVISSHISGSIGLLGADYPGYFPVGDTAALRELLLRAESDPQFLAELQRRCAALAPLFSPHREEESWRELLREIRG